MQKEQMFNERKIINFSSNWLIWFFFFKLETITDLLLGGGGGGGGRGHVAGGGRGGAVGGGGSLGWSKIQLFWKLDENCVRKKAKDHEWLRFSQVQLQQQKNDPPFRHFCFWLAFKQQ